MSVHSLRYSVINVFATIHLFQDCSTHSFKNSLVHGHRTLMVGYGPTRGSQQRFVNIQTKMLPVTLMLYLSNPPRVTYSTLLCSALLCSALLYAVLYAVLYFALCTEDYGIRNKSKLCKDFVLVCQRKSYSGYSKSTVE